MPARKTILAIDETYHVFNRSLRRVPIFTTKKEFDLFLEASKYYLQLNPPVKFSIFRQQPNKYKTSFDKTLVKVIAYCLMPTHYHFILTQKEEGGIKSFIHRLCSSYSSFFNLKYKQQGPVFEGKFKAIRVVTQEQLLHLSRYIHLNPVTDFLVESPEKFKYSSYKDYLIGNASIFVDPKPVMTDFSSVESYKNFVLDHKNYQRELKIIKHLTFE